MSIQVKAFNEKRLKKLINSDKELKLYVESLKKHIESWKKLFYDVQRKRKEELTELEMYRKELKK